MVCPIDEAERGQGQQISGEPGIDPVDVHRRRSLAARALERVTEPRIGVRRVDEPDERGPDHVRPSGQERCQFLERRIGPRLGLRGVDDTVGPELHQ